MDWGQKGAEAMVKVKQSIFNGTLKGCLFEGSTPNNPKTEYVQKDGKEGAESLSTSSPNRRKTRHHWSVRSPFVTTWQVKEKSAVISLCANLWNETRSIGGKATDGV